MRVLVTGATGFIGRSLAARLVNEEGTAVTALIREHHAHRTLPDSLEANRSKINFIYADLRDFQQTKLAVWEVQPDIIFHLAAAGVSDPFLPVIFSCGIHRAMDFAGITTDPDRYCRITQLGHRKRCRSDRG